MSANAVWMVSVEVAPSPGADAPAWCVGAYVDCYVQADDITLAVQRVRSQLHSEKYEVVDISQALRYDPDEFEEEDAAHALAAEAQEAGGDVIYGPFEGWANEGTPAGEVGEA